MAQPGHRQGIRLSRPTTDEELRAIEGEIGREAMAIAALLFNTGTSRPSPVSRVERDAHGESDRP